MTDYGWIQAAMLLAILVAFIFGVCVGILWARRDLGTCPDSLDCPYNYMVPEGSAAPRFQEGPFSISPRFGETEVIL